MFLLQKQTTDSKLVLPCYLAYFLWRGQRGVALKLRQETEHGFSLLRMPCFRPFPLGFECMEVMVMSRLVGEKPIICVLKIFEGCFLQLWWRWKGMCQWCIKKTHLSSIDPREQPETKSNEKQTQRSGETSFRDKAAAANKTSIAPANKR